MKEETDFVVNYYKPNIRILWTLYDVRPSRYKVEQTKDFLSEN